MVSDNIVQRSFVQEWLMKKVVGVNKYLNGFYLFNNLVEIQQVILTN